MYPIVRFVLISCCLHFVLSSYSLLADEADPRVLSANRTVKENSRASKLFSLFTIVRFQNDYCTGDNNSNGTCYTADQCTKLGGSSGGPCALGFGVCCVFTKSCGETTDRNNTYFVNYRHPTSYDGTGSCQLRVNKIDSSICQLRLDFFTLILAQPDAAEARCLNDQFLVTSTSSRAPQICGTNSGQHMYIDVGEGTNTPAMLTVVTSGPSFARSWRILVAQIPCSVSYRAIPSCLQYYTGVSGNIRSFNYDPNTGRQLSNQYYSICIRPEENFCGIAYSVCNGGVFSITGPTEATPNVPGALVGATACVSDWITIPCATDVLGRFTQRGNTTCQDRICGSAFASFVTPNSTTVYSSIRPFQIAVNFDNNENSTVPAQVNNRGFCLSYIQQPCTAGFQ